MWCCPFPIYICVITFFWLRYWSCFPHSDKSGKLFIIFHWGHIRPSYFQTNVLSKINFTNCYNYGFVKYSNRQRISIRKNSLLYSTYMTASPEEPPSVTLRLRVCVQPASPIRTLCDQLRKVYVFSPHKIFTNFCAPFPNRISHFKILTMPSIYVLCPLLTRTQGSLTFPVVWK